MKFRAVFVSYIQNNVRFFDYIIGQFEAHDEIELNSRLITVHLIIIIFRKIKTDALLGDLKKLFFVCRL